MNTDRRIRRTQKLLGEALIALVLEKGYKHITIQDVTERADIGYRTFFRHYNGLDELFIEIAQARVDELYGILDLPQAYEAVTDHVRIFRESGATLFRHIQESPKIFRVLLLDNNLSFILEPVMKMARKKNEALLSGLPNSNIAIPIAANHIIAATFALMRWWLENDMPHPPEKMGEIFTDLIVQPTWLAMTRE
ncbi:MAG: TetR/AcrR family transcriptional regulator [Anaerolineae bacterium]|nr:TetR/AcrR family transcriptional regulator [Anaerolineae bacterium]MBT7069564.1 TetR/AcrR family transcriptional regulator [Anaerolineae bacterium]MBT7325852.1 TetR/AcrR family transcriptional regulator [Anaerolineae bacterium]